MQEYILIVEDDNDINNMLNELLSLNGYRTIQSFSGTEALLHIKQEIPAAVVLDLMLPGMDGESVLAQIKSISSRTAVIVASAKEDIDTRISLLRAGADDYVTKPFDTRELLARLEAVLRRSKKQEDGLESAWECNKHSRIYSGKQLNEENLAYESQLDGRHGEITEHVLRYKDITMYPEDFSVYVGEKELLLTRHEFLILELLMGNPGKVFAKSNIYESVWNEEFIGEDNAVNVHISNIRQKLAKLHPDESYIQTVWGIGFKMKS